MMTVGKRCTSLSLAASFLSHAAEILAANTVCNEAQSIVTE